MHAPDATCPEVDPVRLDLPLEEALHLEDLGDVAPEEAVAVISHVSVEAVSIEGESAVMSAQKNLSSSLNSRSERCSLATYLFLGASLPLMF